MRNFDKIFVVTVFVTCLFGITSCSEKDFLDSPNTANMMMTAENGGYPPTQNGDIRSLFWLFSLMALQN